MGGKEKRNFMLGSLILVLVISIGYFGISSASNTYAIDSGTSDTDATGGSCYYCSSNAPLKRYVWSSTTPTTACSGGNWRIKESRDTVLNVSHLLVIFIIKEKMVWLLELMIQ